MARRQQRSTQPSRSPSRAAQRLPLGDTVRVTAEVMEPASAGDRLGGWRGARGAFEPWEQTPRARMAWDAPTPQGRPRAARQGLSAEPRGRQRRDLARVEWGKGGRRSTGPPWAHGGQASAAPWTPPAWGPTSPDGPRLRAEGRAEGPCVHLTDCRSGGRGEIPCPASILAEEGRRALDAPGSLPGMAEEA